MNHYINVQSQFEILYFVSEILKSEEMNHKMQSAGGMFATYIASSPLWLKLTIGGSLLVYIYIRRKWTALNDCGIDILTPKERISVREFASANYFFKF